MGSSVVLSHVGAAKQSADEVIGSEGISWPAGSTTDPAGVLFPEDLLPDPLVVPAKSACCRRGTWATGREVPHRRGARVVAYAYGTDLLRFPYPFLYPIEPGNLGT